MRRWCAGFFWKMSMLLPISLAMLNCGSSLRRSSSASRISGGELPLFM